jgi:large subunit ribosomal protein L22
MATKDLNLNSAKASVIGLRISPRKTGEVVALIRGRSVADALVILKHTPRRAAESIYKLISSAAANATNNHGIDEKDLLISSIQVGPGVRYKRFRPIARGSAHPYMHRTSNIYVTVSGQEKKASKPAKKSEVKVSEKAPAKKTADKKAAKESK